MSKRFPPIHAAVKSPPDIIAMTGEVTIDAAAEGEAKKGPRKFDVLAYTGGKLVVAGYDLPVVVDLRGLTARKSIVANLDHDRKQRVGHVTARHNDGKTLRLEGLASAATGARDEVVASADNGFQWQASIEAAPQKLVKVPAGKTVEVNGQQFEGPLLIARKSVLGGFAFLSHGADENTSVTIAAAHSSKENDMEFTKWIEALGFELEELSEKQKVALQAKYDAEIKAAAKVGKGEGCIAIAAKSVGDKGKKGLVLRDLQGLPVAKRPSVRSKISCPHFYRPYKGFRFKGRRLCRHMGDPHAAEDAEQQNSL